MISLVILILALVVAAVSLKRFYRKYSTQPEKPDSWVQSKYFWRSLIVPGIILICAIINPLIAERVDAGHVGIKVNLTGDSRGVGKYEYRTGWVIYNSWVSDLYQFPTYQQHIDYAEQQVISRGGFAAVIKPSFNYSLKPGEIGDMFSNLRKPIKDVEQQWLHTAIVGTVNDVANKWTVDSIFNHREKFELDIVDEANKRTTKWFTISQLRTNITPPKELQDAIVQKTKSIQDVQVAEQKRLVAIADMQRKIATAKGDSAEAVINASAGAQVAREQAAGEADAIRLKQNQLTNSYLEYLKLTKWDGALPQVQSGNAGILLNLRKE